ncbi:MAG: glutamine amidotransferase [Verrucomicrobia bacterium]|nr:glutamine amidotransferase [Verrucomicrobiota bacterium]
MKNVVIGWLYPELMNLYGDRGNVMALQKNCEWNHLQAQVKELRLGFSAQELESCDFLTMGGGPDRYQKIAAKDLREKQDVLREKIEGGTPGLFVCGGYQILGHSYQEAEGEVIEGLKIFNIHTENLGKARLVGEIAIQFQDQILRGFENHGGHTYLLEGADPFGEVIQGYGNNGSDKTEGVIYKNCFGTYLHGPILPRNPDFLQYLLELTLRQKYDGYQIRRFEEASSPCC